MTFGQDIQLLYQLGYAWHIDQADLTKLADGDQELQDAILSVQKNYDVEFARLIGKHYGEDIEQRGAYGEAFSELINQPRSCPLPDVAPPPDAQFLFADPLVQQAVESQQVAAQIQSDSKGSGSWPYGCWDGFKMHRVVVAVDKSNWTSRWEQHWPWITNECRVNYSWTGFRIDFVDYKPGVKADVFLEWVSRSSGWLGLAQFNSQRCTDEVFHKLLNSYSPNREMMLNLVEHELGHNVNLQHVGGAYKWIMSPVINPADPDWRNDNSWSTLAKYAGGKGSPAILGDNPPPEDPPPEPEYNGIYYLPNATVRQALEQHPNGAVPFKIKVFT